MVSLPCLARLVRDAARAAGAVLTAGLAGWGVMYLLLALIDLAVGLFSGAASGMGGWLFGILAFPLWIIGAVTVGSPLWAILHRLGRRGRPTAMTAGGVAAALGVVVVFWSLVGPRFLSDVSLVGLMALLSSVAAISGVAAGAVLHTMAYGQAGFAR
jgi:hypothetical protein